MTDVFNKAKRSEVMSAIHSQGNLSTEIALITILRQHKITGWRRNYNLPGRPDFVFPRKKLVVFVDGCFWHGHNCRKRRPAQHKGYWKEKLDRNQKRDRRVTRELRALGWRVIRIWECELEKNRYSRKLRQIKKHLEDASSTETQPGNVTHEQAAH